MLVIDKRFLIYRSRVCDGREDSNFNVFLVLARTLAQLARNCTNTYAVMSVVSTTLFESVNARVRLLLAPMLSSP